MTKFIPVTEPARLPESYEEALNSLQDIFFPLHFSAGFFFPQKSVMCLHLQNVFTFTLWLLL